MTLGFEAVREWATDRASDWALDANGDDRLAIDGLAAAAALRVEAFNLLLPVALDALGIASDFGTGGPIGALKRRGIDRGVRAVALRLGGRRSLGGARRAGGPGKPDQRRIAFVSELATPSTLEPMLAVAAALDAPTWQVVTADPRTDRRWRRSGARPIAMLLPWSEERSVLGRASREAAERWVAIRADPPRFELDGRDLTEPALDALESLVRRSLPWLAVEALALERRLEAIRPSWVVVASDQHRIGRLAVGLAARLGARSLVLQHGLPQYRMGYLPVVADRVATWSETADDWFVDHGTARERLVRLGNPRLDGLVATDRAASAAATSAALGLPGRPRILLALSPNDGDRNRALLELAIGAVAVAPGASLVVKLHPADGRWGPIEAQVRDAGATRARIRIQRREALYPLLGWADLTLLHRSSVAIESLVAGTPVAVGAVGAASLADALPDELRLPEVRDAPELGRLAAELGDAAARARFVEERRAAVVRTSGPLDGRSAERIAAFLRTPEAGAGPATAPAGDDREPAASLRAVGPDATGVAEPGAAEPPPATVGHGSAGQG